MTNLTDKELIESIKINEDHLGIVYKKCKSYSIRFIQNLSQNSISVDEIEDIYHDAVIILYEKIISGNFELTSSIQTYLNSVCRFQLLNRFNKDKNRFEFQENFNSDNDENQKFNPNIVDELEPIEDENEIKFNAIEKALLKIKEAGGNCYELLTLFWYHKKSMSELTGIFGYTNEVNTRNQKMKCQKRLEKLAFNELKN
jgi:RNA polymerase sigma factor (sigma-70 family)